MLRHGFVAVAGNRIVSRQGIRFDNVDYIAVELGTLVGRKVSVRHLPNDRSFIDVYHADRFVCTARATARLGPEQRLEIIRDRRRAVRAVDSIIKRSRRRVIERAYEQHPALAPERDPTLPERHLTGDDDDFLTFLDTLERHDP